MTNNQKLVARKKSLLDLAAMLENVSQACKVMGVSRQHFYDIKKAYESEGLEELQEKNRRVPHRNRIAPEIEERVVKYALEYPAHGQLRAANELHKLGVLISSYCGREDQHPYQLFLGLEEIEHTRTRAASPQTNGICERFHQTVLNEFYKVTFRKKIYADLESLQQDLDEWLVYYNHQRTHQGKRCLGQTPMETFLKAKPLVVVKNLNILAHGQEPKAGPDLAA